MFIILLTSTETNREVVKMLKKNVGTVDRIVRVLIGIALIALAVTGKFSPWGYIGIVPLATGVMSSCMLYNLFGIDTNKK